MTDAKWAAEELRPPRVQAWHEYAVPIIQRAIDSATAQLRAENKRLEAEVQVLTKSRDHYMADADLLRDSFAVLRDCVLHERHQLAEAGLDSDQVNAVLGLIGYHTPPTPTLPSANDLVDLAVDPCAERMGKPDNVDDELAALRREHEAGCRLNNCIPSRIDRTEGWIGTPYKRILTEWSMAHADAHAAVASLSKENKQ